ncbi:putative lipoprotein [Clostridium sp. CAG:505]|nr:putative lipoprotein [Firmicutes bacterium CAG:466]CDD62714.1 putative lipoprotein [Clostridium sp. CAG:505]
MKKRKKHLKILFLTMAALLISSCGQQTESPQQDTSEGLLINDGSQEEVVEFNHTVELTKGNGEYVHFWIENTGDKDIAITINETAEVIVAPGEEGETSVKTGMFAKDYVCKAVPSGAGGRISLAYRITQGEKSET